MSGCGPTPDLDVVAIERDVDRSEIGCRAGSLLDQPSQTVRERHATRLNADERDASEVGIRLDDLVRDPRQRPAERIGIEQDGSRRGLHRAHGTGGVNGLRARRFIRLLPGLTGPA
jgi:hypothetical protein